jgi:putative ABC transport system substrate-binding protein
MNRREFIALFGGAAAAWPLAALAQQPARVPRIGIVDDAPMWQSFRQALREFGYAEGQSINYEYRYSGGMPDRLAAVVGELVRRPVDLIAAYGTPPIEAAKAATTTIPIVMIGVGDPVRVGLPRPPSLCWPYPQWRKACRLAGHAVDQVRVCYQPPNGQSSPRQSRDGRV